MRALDCECGHHLEAPNERELTARVREHVEYSHPEMQLGEEGIQKLVSEKSYDQPDEHGAVDQRGITGA